jgi:hypothetical protein
MKKVTLQFTDLLQLLEFMDITNTRDCPIDTNTLQLKCELSEADLELAQNAYNALVVDQPQ